MLFRSRLRTVCLQNCGRSTMKSKILRARFAGAVVLAGAIALAPLIVLAAGLPGSQGHQPAPQKVSAAVPGAEQMAQTISTITGVAISPLLGMGAVGAWQYFKWQGTAESTRGPLPWYANPLFWLPALLIVGLVGAKDVFGTAAPSALKKPFDIAELLENKISGDRKSTRLNSSHT